MPDLSVGYPDRRAVMPFELSDGKQLRDDAVSGMRIRNAARIEAGISHPEMDAER